MRRRAVPSHCRPVAPPAAVALALPVPPECVDTLSVPFRELLGHEFAGHVREGCHVGRQRGLPQQPLAGREVGDDREHNQGGRKEGSDQAGRGARQPIRPTEHRRPEQTPKDAGQESARQHRAQEDDQVTDQAGRRLRYAQRAGDRSGCQRVELGCEDERHHQRSGPDQQSHEPLEEARQHQQAGEDEQQQVEGVEVHFAHQRSRRSGRRSGIAHGA